MATVKNSIILNKISGKLYGLIFKQYRSGVVISKVPDMSGVARSDKQLQRNRQFALSVDQARAMLKDPEKRQILLDKRASLPHHKKRSLYHMAMRECLSKQKSSTEINLCFEIACYWRIAFT